MVDEKWYKRATYDYSEQAKKLHSDLKAKGCLRKILTVLYGM